MISRFLIILSLMVGLGPFCFALGVDKSSGNLLVQRCEAATNAPQNWHCHGMGNCTTSSTL